MGSRRGSEGDGGAEPEVTDLERIWEATDTGVPAAPSGSGPEQAAGAQGAERPEAGGPGLAGTGLSGTGPRRPEQAVAAQGAEEPEPALPFGPGPVDPWAELTPPEEPAAGEAADWVEAEALEGDGPFAVALDAPRGTALDAPPRLRFDFDAGPRDATTFATRTVGDLSQPLRAPQRPLEAERARVAEPNKPGIRVDQGRAEAPVQLGGPVVVTRRATKARAEGLRGTIGAPRVTPPPERRYPRMRALLRDPDLVPFGCEPPARGAPPVPGTFFPAPREPLERPAPADLDAMLTTMAEGLLIGENRAGQTEVRVTLKDEFFAGTELRIAVGGGEVCAVLVPPDRDIYWQLNANLEELRARLSARGLRVTEIRVAEP